MLTKGLAKHLFERRASRSLTEAGERRFTIARACGWANLGWLACLLVGCSSRGAELAPVSGRVTLDGEPLANTMVEFQPSQGGTSYARTGADGSYTLHYTRDRAGARLGQHTVRIVTVFSFDDVNVPKAKERVPDRYNRKTTLTAEVTQGKNVIDFPLTTAADRSP